MIKNSVITLLSGRSRDVTLKVAGHVLSCLSHRSLAREALHYLESGDHCGLLGLSVDPTAYIDVDDFKDDYLVVSLLSKSVSLTTGIDKEKVALEKFFDSEKQCAAANERLQSAYAGSHSHDPVLSSILYRAQVKIGALLPDFSWEAALPYCGFGPGASLSLNRTYGDAYYKFGNLMPTVTMGCARVAESAVSSIPRWFCHLFSTDSSGAFKIVPGNRITTVPKSAKTDRVIAIEPDLNMYCQKGIGGLIRRALKSVGVDLDSQEKNQRLARIGSVTDALATVDLSSASDTICLELVEQLLPVDWVDAILSTRSPSGTLPDGTVLTYQKVSSMGNGFTFELESLLFWALSQSVMDYVGEKDRRLAIYGDDIVIPVSCVGLLSRVFAFVGFTFNETKSFRSGPFRESCGKHYFGGVDVTPFFLRKEVDSPERLFWWCNTIRRYSADPDLGYCRSSLRAAYDAGVLLLPRRLRVPTVPLHINNVQYSDTALGGDFDEVQPKFNRALQEYDAVGWVRSFSTKPGQGYPYLLRQLNQLERADCGVGVIGGASLSGVSTQRWTYRKVKSCVPQWGNVGPWI